MRIFRRGLTSTEWATLAGLLFKAEYSVTPAKHKETERGRPVPCIELQDTKKYRPRRCELRRRQGKLIRLDYKAEKKGNQDGERKTPGTH